MDHELKTSNESGKNTVVKPLHNLLPLILLFNLTACGTTMAKSKFDWKATESAPKNYPIEVVKGDFFAPDGYSLYVPNGKTVNHGWGRGVSNHQVGPDEKSLPNRLEILFFSYTEDKFYKGDFKLPYAKILQLFQQGYYSPKVERQETYFEIIAGIAPGGLVSVWLGGIDSTIEVFSGQAKETDVDWKRMIDNPNVTRQEFIDTSVNFSREKLNENELKKLQQNGVPHSLWDSYRKRYHWQPLFTVNAPPDLIHLIKYYNGEEGYLDYPLDEESAAKTRAIPKEYHVHWSLINDIKRSINIYFDEEEITAAFEKFDQDTPLYLRLHTESQKNGRPGMWVILQNANDEKERVILRKMQVEFFGV